MRIEVKKSAETAKKGLTKKEKYGIIKITKERKEVQKI